MRRLAFVVAALAWCLLVRPAPALAQWYFDGYFGANHTRPADIAINQPASGLALDFLDVEFSAEPVKSPPYYGWRAGRWLGVERRVGVEFEFLHLKVIADTSQAYAVENRSPRREWLAIGPMSDVVERYSMTHGLNFLFVNAVLRQPFGNGRHAVVARVGAGPTLPHAESEVLGEQQEQYEYAGPGAQVALGATLGVWQRVAALADYKLTFARPRITLAGGGTGQTTTLTHQIAIGFSIALGR